jgi:hypothetical protein
MKAARELVRLAVAHGFEIVRIGGGQRLIILPAEPDVVVGVDDERIAELFDQDDDARIAHAGPSEATRSKMRAAIEHASSKKDGKS